MVLKEFTILNNNHKTIILAAMAVGILYPYFTDLDLPVSPKYISIGSLLAGMVLFWEFYGNKKYEGREPIEYGNQQRQRTQQPYPQQIPPQHQMYPQPYYNPSPQQPTQSPPPQQYRHAPRFEDQMFSEANIPRSMAKPVNPLYNPKPHIRYEEETQEEYTEMGEEQQLPKISDVMIDKSKIPARIPTPKEVSYSKTAQKSAFKKFRL